MKIKARSRKRSHKLDGSRVGRITTFSFSSDSDYDPSLTDLVKTRLSEMNTEAEEQTNHNDQIQALCLVYSSASASDSDNLVFTRS